MDETIDNTNDQTIKRHSGIDLLRIIAIFLICLSHANQTFRNLFDLPSFDFINMVTVGLSPLGTMGNILFVICSSYFLVDKTKSRTEKAINLLMDSTLISICILIGFLISGEPLTWETILQQIFPDISGLNWFVPCYVIFYLLAPIVVFGLKHLTKKQHFAFTIASLVVYGCLSMISLAPVGSYLFQFFYILNLVAFVKWNAPSIYSHRKVNFFVFLVGMIVCYLGYFGFLVLSKQNAFFGRFSFISMLSPLSVIPLMALFNCFKEMKFDSKFISYLSTCSLFVYVIHENYLLRGITRVNYYNWAVGTFGDRLMLVYLIICGLFMFVVGFILAVIYKETFSRLTKFCSKKVDNVLRMIISKLYNKCFKKVEQVE